METAPAENIVALEYARPRAGGLEIGTIKRLLLAALFFGGLGAATVAFASDTVPESRSADPANAQSGPYAGYSDDELTALAARWDVLNVHQRRALLTEVRSRMALRGAEGAPGIRIQTERRYGRLVRRSDGRVIHIQTQVVRVLPAREGDSPAVAHLPDEESVSGDGASVRRVGGYGIGFEHRSRVEGPAAGAEQPTEMGGSAGNPADELSAGQASTSAKLSGAEELQKSTN